jgi:hypothetical protein
VEENERRLKREISMALYTYHNGREVFVARVSIVGTYDGWMEGTPERISASIRAPMDF